MGLFKRKEKKSKLKGFFDDVFDVFDEAEMRFGNRDGDDGEDDFLNIRINTHGNPMPKKHGEWIDLATASDVELVKGEFQIISLGVSMELPEGYYAEIVPRSSTFKKYKIILANSMGVIDNAYRGDNDIWGFPAIAVKDTMIPKGTRICQFRIVKNPPKVRFEKVETLGNKNRGGFGSTGD